MYQITHNENLWPKSLFILVGLIGGLWINGLLFLGVDRVVGDWWALLSAWPTVTGVLLLLAFKNTRAWLPLLCSTIATAFVITELTDFVKMPSVSQGILIYLVSYALCAFTVAYNDKGYPFIYSVLFMAVWNLIIRVTVACMFLCLTGIILVAACVLANFAGIPQFTDLIKSQYFMSGLSYFIYCIGLYVGFVNEKIINDLRTIVLITAQALLPVLAIFTLVFCMAMLFNINQADIKESYSIFTGINFLGLLLLNAVYQMGDKPAPYGIVLQKIVHCFIATLPLTALLAIAACIMSDKPYFSNPLFFELLCSVILFVYGCCYTFAMLRTKPGIWMPFVASANTYIAYGVIAVVIVSSLLLPNTSADTAVVQPSKQLSYSDELAKTGVRWIPASSATSSPQRFVVAYRNNKPVYLCRAKFADVYYAGMLYEDHCVVADAKRAVMEAPQYDILVAAGSNYSWSQTYDTPLFSDSRARFLLYTNDDDTHRPLNSVCRVIYDNQIYVGSTPVYNNRGYSLKSGEGCVIAHEGKVVKQANGQNLVITNNPVK